MTHPTTNTIEEDVRLKNEVRSNDLLALALKWHRDGCQVAIATVVKTWGSSPRPTGSMLIIREDGTFEGSVSGGCVEGEVIKTAQELIRGSGIRLIEFGVTNEMAWEVGLACGGHIEVLIERLHED